MIAVGDNFHIRNDLIREIQVLEYTGSWLCRVTYDGMGGVRQHDTLYSNFEEALEDAEAMLALCN